MLRRKKIFK